jgi:fibro-slime domain-containing protein
MFMKHPRSQRRASASSTARARAHGVRVRVIAMLACGATTWGCSGTTLDERRLPLTGGAATAGSLAQASPADLAAPPAAVGAPPNAAPGAAAGALPGSTGQASGNNLAPSQPAGPQPVPADFTKTQIGGYKLGAVLGQNTVASPLGGAEAAHGCSVMTGVIRDFRGKTEPQGHPDFEAFAGSSPTRGLVAAVLGSDSKPSYASRCESSPDATACPFGQMTSGQAAFEQWYKSSDDVGRPFAIELSFQPNAGLFTFQSDSFFPLDGSGWGNSGAHNFGFTTEIHATLAYRGGEHFSFTGDDDLWVFINGKLAIDLGGLHPPASETLDLDAAASALGISVGGTYAFDLFHAERHSEASNFRVDTTLQFTDCGTAAPD